MKHLNIIKKIEEVASMPLPKTGAFNIWVYALTPKPGKGKTTILTGTFSDKQIKIKGRYYYINKSDLGVFICYENTKNYIYKNQTNESNNKKRPC